jgi:hypothetical protein
MSNGKKKRTDSIQPGIHRRLRNLTNESYTVANVLSGLPENRTPTSQDSTSFRQGYNPAVKGQSLNFNPQETNDQFFISGHTAGKAARRMLQGNPQGLDYNAINFKNKTIDKLNR